MIAGLSMADMPGMLVGEVLDLYMVRRDYDMTMHGLQEQHGGD